LSDDASAALPATDRQPTGFGQKRLMPTIMLSYRRDDSKWIAGRIFDRLEGHYGRGNVFMDIDNIPVGLDFREHLQQSLQRCDILLAIVGPRWLGTDEHGRHALAEETDWVRIEIETALAEQIPVIPVLIDRLRMPKATELPESLRNFAFRQAAEVDSGIDFRLHLDRLIRSMDQYLQGRLAVTSTAPAALVQQPDRQMPDAREIAAEGSRADDIAAVARPTPPSLSPQAGPGIARSAIARSVMGSWIGIGAFLLGSELFAFLSEQAAAGNNRLLFIALTALPLGAIGLISIGFRLFGYVKSSGAKAGVRSALSVVGILSVAAVPSFFHATHPPDQNVVAAAWPLVLLGGLGLVLIATVLISLAAGAEGQSRSVKAWIGFGIVLLALAWLDSNPTSTYLSMLDWRVRSVLLFSYVFVGSTILAVLAACALARFARNGSANAVGGNSA
jgi:hypothetical protein